MIKSTHARFAKQPKTENLIPQGNSVNA